MADTKISALPTMSVPSSADYVPIVNVSAGQTQKITLATLSMRMATSIQAAFADSNPADGTTYYYGSIPSQPLATNAARRRLYIPCSGNITKCFLFFTFTAGTTETSTASIRLNNTTDTTISSAVNLSSNPYAVSNTSLNVAVVAGDYIEIKWVTPTWVTNPTGVSGSAMIVIE